MQSNKRSEPCSTFQMDQQKKVVVGWLPVAFDAVGVEVAAGGPIDIKYFFSFWQTSSFLCVREIKCFW